MAVGRSDQEQRQRDRCAIAQRAGEEDRTDGEAEQRDAERRSPVGLGRRRRRSGGAAPASPARGGPCRRDRRAPRHSLPAARRGPAWRRIAARARPARAEAPLPPAHPARSAARRAPRVAAGTSPPPGGWPRRASRAQAAPRRLLAPASRRPRSRPARAPELAPGRRCEPPPARGRAPRSAARRREPSPPAGASGDRGRRRAGARSAS